MNPLLRYKSHELEVICVLMFSIMSFYQCTEFFIKCKSITHFKFKRSVFCLVCLSLFLEVKLLKKFYTLSL